MTCSQNVPAHSIDGLRATRLSHSCYVRIQDSTYVARMRIDGERGLEGAKAEEQFQCRRRPPAPARRPHMASTLHIR